LSKICLINPPIRTWTAPNCFPLGLGYIASMLDINGHEVKVLDINALRLDKAQVEQKIKYSKADVFCLTGLVTSYKYIKWLVEKIRDYHQSKKIVLGGAIANSSTAQVNKLTDGMIDTFCVGEGEEAIVEIMDSYKGEEHLKFIHKKKPIEPLDKIPFPAWDMFPIHTYIKNPIGGINTQKWKNGKSVCKIKSMNLIASRGCVYGCCYCYHDFAGYKYRHRSVPNIIAEMEALIDRYDISHFHFVDDEFVLDKNFVHELCDSLFHLGVTQEWWPAITWGCTGNARIMDKDLLRHMAESGCIHISYGIESGSQKMLDWMEKKITVERAKESVMLTERYIKNPSYTFMVGYPGESVETLSETIQFCNDTHIKAEAVFFLTPYPGTSVYTWALKKGYITDEGAYLELLADNEQGNNCLVNLTRFEKSTLVDLKNHVAKTIGAQNV